MGTQTHHQDTAGCEREREREWGGGGGGGGGGDGVYQAYSCIALPNIFGFDSASLAASVAQLVKHHLEGMLRVRILPKAAQFSLKITGCFGCMQLHINLALSFMHMRERRGGEMVVCVCREEVEIG